MDATPAAAPPTRSDTAAALTSVARPAGAARGRSALTDTLIATVGSRVLIWCAGVIAISAFGAIASPGGTTVPGLNSGLGQLDERLIAPVAHWDASWFLMIAQHGYYAGAGSPNLRVAFFPLYPLLMSAIGSTGVPLVLAGALISTVCLGLAIYGIHLLVELELGPHPEGRRAGRLAGLSLALCPMAVFFSAVYSDSLYLALSVGVFLYARRGRWAIAGALAALAAASRANGVLLLVPLVILYLYGPRADRPPDRPPEGLLPRYRISKEIGWLALAPLGLLAFMAYLAANGSGALAPFHIEQVWGHHFAGPIGGIWDGLKSAVHDLGSLLSGRSRLELLSTDSASSVITGWQNLMPFAFLLLTLPAIVGVARTLPRAYLLYVLVALAAAVSEPVATRPLQSLPRYEVVLFPLFMWFGVWLVRHRRWQLPLLAGSAALAALFAAEFATWHFVA